MAIDHVAAVLGALIALYPAFRFDHAPIRKREQRWTACRINSSEPGLHTVITPDLDELLNALNQEHARTEANDPDERRHHDQPRQHQARLHPGRRRRHHPHPGRPLHRQAPQRTPARRGFDTKVASVYQRQGIATELVGLATPHAKAAGCEWLHVDFEELLAPFYFDACGFRPTLAGLIHLPSLQKTG